jgi:hypothetical protein
MRVNLWKSHISGKGRRALDNVKIDIAAFKSRMAGYSIKMSGIFLDWCCLEKSNPAPIS